MKKERENIDKLNNLLEKFKHIGYLNFKDVIKQLTNYETITQKLNYLKKVKEDYYDEYEKVIETLNKDEDILFINNHEAVSEAVFGNHTLVTPLKIQEPVFNKYFRDTKVGDDFTYQLPEFTYWFLKYNSEYAFNLHINQKKFKSQVRSKHKDTFIEAEINQLNDFEEKAKNLLLKKKLDIYEPHRNNYTYNKEIVLLRVLAGNYYKENATYTINDIGSDEVQTYFKHILLKPYLEKLFKGNVYSPNFKKEPYLKDLFVDNGDKYDDIINLLITNKFVTKNDNGTLNWKGAEEDRSLKDKTLICTLAVVLGNKDYFEPSLTNANIARALTNTFKNITISGKIFGETRNNFSNKPHYSKPFFFIN